MKMKNNFIVVCMKGELYRYAYSQLNEINYAFFDEGFPNNTILNLLYKVHCSYKINRIINLPLKEIWINKRINLYKKKVLEMQDPNKSICFVLFADCYYLEKYGFSEKLKKTFKDCKVIYFFQDLVSKDENKIKLIEGQIKSVDAIYTFDNLDAEKYGLRFHNIAYSELSNIIKKTTKIYDVVFVGLAKDRLKIILDVCKYLTERKIKCAFYIVGAGKNDLPDIEGVHYISPLSYNEYLNTLNQGKCILEIMQEGGTGNTIRVNEARAMGLKLITNNAFLYDNCLYDKHNMFIFNRLEDLCDINEFIDRETTTYNNGVMLPSTFFSDIERDINENN